jgi:hypothetical protein
VLAGTYGGEWEILSQAGDVLIAHNLEAADD